MSQIHAQVRDMILTRFLDPAAKLGDDDSLERTHVVDSARALEIILFVEETFGVQVENEEALPENFDSVNRIAAYVHRKQGGAR